MLVYRVDDRAPMTWRSEEQQHNIMRPAEDDAYVLRITDSDIRVYKDRNIVRSSAFLFLFALSTFLIFCSVVAPAC
jgi:hypothetical protein